MMMQTYQQQGQQQHDDDSEGKLFVGGLAWESNEESIKQYFEQYGVVQSVNLKRNKEDPTKHRGFCFVKFASQEQADAVLSHPEPHYLDGSKIDPKSACPAGVRPEQRTKKIFVGGLQEQTTEERLLEYFGQFGQVLNKIEFAIDRNTGKKRGFCFIEFASESIVDRIVKEKFHEVAGKRLETKRALSKQQQAEEAARQAAQSVIPGTHNVASLTPQILAGAGGAYGIQQAGMQQYAQPVIYIHPDSLSTQYPTAALGVQSAYQSYQQPAYPQATVASQAAAVAQPQTGYETLYQPYAKTQASRPAGASAVASVSAQRHMPYTNRKY